MTAALIVEAVRRSIAELRLHNRETVAIRIHPLDAEILRSELPRKYPSVFPERLEIPTRLLGAPLFLDESIRRGEPVAEWDPLALSSSETPDG